MASSHFGMRFLEEAIWWARIIGFGNSRILLDACDLR